MTIIKPTDSSNASSILAKLAVGAGKRMGFKLKPYDMSTTTDGSGFVHWMYKFDEYESRIYRVQTGLHRFVDVEIGKDGLVDLNDAETRIREAILKLTSRLF